MPRRSVGTARGRSPAPRRARTPPRRRVRPARTRRSASPACTRRVAQRFPRRGGQRLGLAVEHPLAQNRQLHRRIMIVLHFGDRLAQRGAQGLRAQLDLARHPGAQLVLLPARQPLHRGRVVRLALDEREGLQHGIVQVGGDAAALVLTRGGQTRAVRAGQPRDEEGHGDDGRRAAAQHEQQGQGQEAPAATGTDVAEPEDESQAHQRKSTERAPGRRHGCVRRAGQPLPRREATLRQPEAGAQVVGDQDQAAERRERDDRERHQGEDELRQRPQGAAVGEVAEEHDQRERHRGHGRADEQHGLPARSRVSAARDEHEQREHGARAQQRERQRVAAVAE